MDSCSWLSVIVQRVRARILLCFFVQVSKVELAVDVESFKIGLLSNWFISGLLFQSQLFLRYLEQIVDLEVPVRKRMIVCRDTGTRFDM